MFAGWRKTMITGERRPSGAGSTLQILRACQAAGTSSGPPQPSALILSSEPVRTPVEELASAKDRHAQALQRLREHIQQLASPSKGWPQGAGRPEEIAQAQERISLLRIKAHATADILHSLMQKLQSMLDHMAMWDNSTMQTGL
ncbi:hypothetical protein WJX73_005365 [Symbiochloris irregularis]|uniref:Uncharacterized protein n=1 Tax=Symbiochloris irregularis TaxID=706552 RepID=A0AAW1P6K0_9CHLO